MKYNILLLLVALVSNHLLAQQHSNYYLEEGVAIGGYDPVAYFTENKAVEGSKQFQTQYDGVVFYFKSESNRQLFLKSPEKYLPQYGGWCAYAMGDSGEKVKIDPETFKIVDGKLYLFYNFYFTNTLTKWNADEANLKMKADQNWEKLVK